MDVDVATLKILCTAEAGRVIVRMMLFREVVPVTAMFNS